MDLPFTGGCIYPRLTVIKVMIVIFVAALFSLLSHASANSISTEQLWNITRYVEAPTAILFHNNASADVSWWSKLDIGVTKYEFATDNILNSLEAKSQNIRKIPTIKLYHYRTANTLEPEQVSDIKPWVDLHTAAVAKLTSKTFHHFANDNSAVLLALSDSMCAALEKENRSNHIKYACYTEDNIIPGCHLALFGKYMDAVCVEEGVNGIQQALQKAFPPLLDSRMMNDPLLYELRPHNESIFVISDTPPEVDNVPDHIHIIWERTKSHLMGVYNPTVLRQSLWTWYGHELKSEEACRTAVHDVLAHTTPLNTSRVFAALQSNNFSLYFDESWRGMKELFPRRHKIKEFNFSNIKLPKIPEIKLSLENDKKIAESFGVNVDELSVKRPSLEEWGDDFHEKRKGRGTLVKFYAPWCGHCKRFAEPYKKIAEELADDDVNVVKLDATKHRGVYKVKGIPTIVFFPADGDEIKFKGKRDVSTIVGWTRKQLKASAENKKLEL